MGGGAPVGCSDPWGSGDPWVVARPSPAVLRKCARQGALGTPTMRSYVVSAMASPFYQVLGMWGGSPAFHQWKMQCGQPLCYRQPCCKHAEQVPRLARSAAEYMLPRSTDLMERACFPMPTTSPWQMLDASSPKPPSKWWATRTVPPMLMSQRSQKGGPRRVVPPLQVADLPPCPSLRTTAPLARHST